LAAPIRANVGIKRTTTSILKLVELLNLAFGLRTLPIAGLNAKFAPLGLRPPPRNTLATILPHEKPLC
jgi:hypothetical protein